VSPGDRDQVVGGIPVFAQLANDVDKKRIVVAGYGDGAAAALVAASRQKEIDGVVTVGAAGTRGADLILEQQQQVLNALKLPPEERQNRIELQKKILSAVINGTGWEGVPAAMRRQADTPWFRSVLTFDPAQAVARVKKPLLILHAELDPNIPPTEADRLAALAAARKKVVPPEVVKVPGANNTLASPGGKAIDPAFAAAIAEWVKKL
jgi:pimeloyl-ACP methyl ester carboxylesterase